MANAMRIPIISSIGVLLAFFLFFHLTEPFSQKTKPQRVRTCMRDPRNYGPRCSEDPSGGWSLCEDARGVCRLGRPCGYILNCNNSFTCEDALGPCVGPPYPSFPPEPA